MLSFSRRKQGRSSDPSVFPLHRLEGLSDGIFAIAMTLLVLNIPLPGEDQAVNSDGMLINFLTGAGKLFHTFAISFMLLAIFWMIQQKLYRNLRSTCSSHLWLSLGGLFFVCLIPFSSSLIGRFGDLFVADCFFHLNIFCISIMLLLQWLILRKHPELLKEGVDIQTFHAGIRVNMVLPVLSLVGIGVASFAPSWSGIVYAVTPFIIPRLRERVPGPDAGGGEEGDS